MATQNELEQILKLHHICMELSGVIAEFRTMPCSSLEQRMFGTLDRYKGRISEYQPTHEQREEWRAINQPSKEGQQA